MIENASPLKQTHLGSALGSTSMLRPKNNSHARRTMIASLMLTSLVDAFSILVIFLIMNHSANNEVINVGDKVQLPQARESQTIQSGVVVRIEAGRFLVDDKPVVRENLIARLKALNTGADMAKREGLIIVADRAMDYADLSPVILAGSQAGYSKIKFTVIRKD